MLQPFKRYHRGFAVSQVQLYLNGIHRNKSRTLRIMSTIVKSKNDYREYRLITLKNQLRALLISDLGINDEVNKDSDGDRSSESESDTEMDHSGPTAGHSDGSEDSEMSDNEVLTPPSKAPKHNEKKSAAALCIGVGSFSDPEEIPGFAHFLEHMVFMGSEKYPKENELDDFLGKHGGYSNAWTDCERTCFYFEVEKKYFRKALDKFAQFFISPLLLENAVDREIQAVDSEFQMSLPSDQDRINQLLGSFAKPGHPMSRFFTGNTDTLKTIPQSKGLNIYEKLRSFYKRIYSAHYMTLAIHSRDSLDDMEEWVQEIFSSVPNNNLPKLSYRDKQEPFDTERFRKLYKVIPVEDEDKLLIVWSYPPLLLDKYRNKPLDYMSSLLCHEGRGSILSYLRKKFWALSIVGGYSYDGFECNTTWNCFSAEIKLTDKGFDNYIEVLKVIFAYINMLQSNGPQKWLFDEEKTIEDTKFRWKEQIDPIDYVEKVSENMQMFDEADILSGRLLLFEYDEELTRNCLNLLQPDNCNIILSSKKFEKLDVCQEEEYWYKTKYCSENIDLQLIETLKNPSPYPELSLPAPNIFIATDFTLHQMEEKHITKYPVVLVDNEFCKLWYKKDTKFKVPKGCIYLHLTTPIAGKSLQSSVLFDIFVNILQQNVVEPAYPATSAGYDYSIQGYDTGLVISLKGFDHKIQNLFELILEEIFTFTCTGGLFDMIKEQLKKSYHNKMLQPYEFANTVRFSVLKPTYWPYTEKHSVIDDMTMEEFMKFTKEFLSQLYVEGLISGNFTPGNVDLYGNLLKSKMKDQQPLPNTEHLKTRLLEVPKDQYYCQVQSLNHDDANSCVTVYLQSLPGTLYTSCLNELLATRMHEPCFDILRTKHQLGYSVFAEGLVTYGILGLAVTVEYQANKFSVQMVDQHIQDFLQEFENILNETSIEEFTELVESLITAKMIEDSNLQEEVDNHWREIENRTYLFDRRDKEIEILKTLKLETLKGWLTQYLGNAQRAISFQVLGKDDKETDETDSQQKILTNKIAPIKISTSGHGDGEILTNGYHSLKCLEDKNQTRSKQISDVFTFKKTLNLHPFTKIVK